MRNFFFLILILGCIIKVNAQTGPGGVGATDGTSNLVLWLDANTVTATDGSTVTSWNDKSGYANNYTAGNGAVYYNDVQNGNAAFSFNGSSHYFERAYTADLNTNDFSLFVVDRVYSKSDWSSVFTSRDDYPQRGYILYAQNSSYNWTGWIGNGSSWTHSNSGTSTLNYWSGQCFTFSSGVSNAQKVYVNGAFKSQNTATISLNTAKPSRIGAGKTEGSPSYYFKGNISELIIFKTVLNSAQRIIIQNYLSAKYDYVLAANDKYAGDDAANGNYDLHMIGIGTESDGSQTISNDGVGLTITQASGFDNGDYLMAGNWAETNAANHTDVGGLPGLQARWNRIWYFDVTDANTAMTVDITFDFSDAGISQTPGTASNYKLIYRSGTSGNWSDAASTITPTKNGDQLTFSGVSLIDGYYTLGSLDTLSSTLPVELLGFNAILENGRVELTWQTAAEINNACFEVERSNDGVNWEVIQKVKGAGNSNAIRAYKTIDANPVRGTNYYRLKQVDFDGGFTYSAIRKVTVENPKTLKVYPNPAKESLFVEASVTRLNNIRLYNSLGMEVSGRIKISAPGKEKRRLDISQLPGGVYYLQAGDKMVKVIKP